jgi:hypothetical protein
MTNSLFKKTVVISLLWHCAFLSVFRVSSGTHFPAARSSGIFFWGSLLNRYDLSVPHPAPSLAQKLFPQKPDASALDKNRPVLPVTTYALKPLARLSIGGDKQAWSQGARTAFSALPRKKSVLMFYPHLPYHFLLYFKDRQNVHIELSFKVASTGQNNAIAIKRKISSGNLEADLLTARYLSHYLFIQQMGFPANTWQTVKIELSPKND